MTTFTVHEDAPGNYVAELNSGSNSEITHNRFYIPETAQSMQLSARVKDKEFFRTGRLTVSISLDGTNFESIGSFDLTATSSTYGTYTFSLNTTPLGNMSGKMGYVRFELTHPGGGSQSGIDRVYIDNVRLLGVGLPLQTESAIVTNANTSSQVAQTSIASLIEAAQSHWQDLIETPNGIGGLTLGQSGVTTPNFSFENVADIDMESSEQNGNAGSGEGGFHNQLFIANSRTSLAMDVVFDQEAGSAGASVAADQLGFDSNASLASDSHAIDSQPDSSLSNKSSGLIVGIVDERASVETNVIMDGPLIGDRPIGISNADVSADFSTPSSNGATTNIEVLNFEKLSLVPFMQLPTVLGHGNQLVGSSTLFNAASGLGQSQHQQNQSAFDHSLSFGSQTLPTDRHLVNPSVGNGLSGLFGLSSLSSPEASNPSPFTRHSSLSFDQLALLSKATITIADLADGYLALTTGTTITLDTNAAGYGWFVDPTPFLNEEWRPRETSET